jgi:hypothetical protein
MMNDTLVWLSVVCDDLGSGWQAKSQSERIDFSRLQGVEKPPEGRGDFGRHRHPAQ